MRKQVLRAKVSVLKPLPGSECSGAETGFTPGTVPSNSLLQGLQHFPSRKEENISSDKSSTPKSSLQAFRLLVLFNVPELLLVNIYLLNKVTSPTFGSHTAALS